jgi:hypothetical protein
VPFGKRLPDVDPSFTGAFKINVAWPKEQKAIATNAKIKVNFFMSYVFKF